jgi:hypothetical protein
MNGAFRTYVGLDEHKHAVRATNRVHLVREVDGRRQYGPIKAMEQNEKGGAQTYVARSWVRENGEWVPEFGLDSRDVRDKLASATTGAGWVWRGWGLRL